METLDPNKLGEDRGNRSGFYNIRCTRALGVTKACTVIAVVGFGGRGK